ncbi:helix-turn-helix domain-containing protein [Pseudoalteromonas ulvae]|uniref:XRE family transcriptional regulator n=1 Tax=Pseudoalteromonas ulvae TaxID=107327 RepID=A0A244CT67_PSEDV|nr:helix-turn-helix domain-containing protein [Pseudoalteromonas ulvae]OUL58807.1 XRE family transcriptional regulator [Pseudoalteromonas ulvae]
MIIDTQRIITLRKEQAWSQEELALASGLNIRTIQRIESQGHASLQSKKAIAAAFDVAISTFDKQLTPSLKQYEFKTLTIENNQGFLAGLKKSTLPDLASILNQQGLEGWSLVQILTPDLAQGVHTGKTGQLVAVLQREIHQGAAEC